MSTDEDDDENLVLDLITKVDERTAQLLELLLKVSTALTVELEKSLLTVEFGTSLIQRQRHKMALHPSKIQKIVNQYRQVAAKCKSVSRLEELELDATIAYEDAETDLGCSFAEFKDAYPLCLEQTRKSLKRFAKHANLNTSKVIVSPESMETARQVAKNLQALVDTHNPDPKSRLVKYTKAVNSILNRSKPASTTLR